MADVLALRELLARLAPDVHDFAEVFRSASGALSLTVARWPAGSADDQQPHTEEVYYVAAGHARLRIGDEEVELQSGSVAFVAAGVEHRFNRIEEDLEVLVFWWPARHTNART